MGLIGRFWSDESGATAVEYALIAGAIALVIIVSLRSIGTRSSARFTAVANNLT